MTIECRESVLFVIGKRIREVPVGTEEVLERLKVGTKPHEVIGRSLIVESPDRIVVRFHGDTFIDDATYEKEAINKASIKPNSLGDIIKQRRYYWR